MSDSRWWLKRFALVAGILLLITLIAVTFFVVWTRTGPGPRIGVSVSSDWYDRMQVHRAPYDLAIRRAGGTVVTIEPDLARIDEILDAIDGLVLAGGGDIHPARTGCDPDKSFLVDPVRDDFEFALLRKAKERGIPVLAICRGIQVLALAEGGTIQDLKGESLERHNVGVKGSLQGHPVEIVPGTRLHALMGPGPHNVNSMHDQGVMDAGPNLWVAARTEDGVIEAVELPGDRMVIGIQWHPELRLHLAPFEMLVEEAKK